MSSDHGCKEFLAQFYTLIGKRQWKCNICNDIMGSLNGIVGHVGRVHHKIKAYPRYNDYFAKKPRKTSRKFKSSKEQCSVKGYSEFVHGVNAVSSPHTAPQVKNMSEIPHTLMEGFSDVNSTSSSLKKLVVDLSREDESSPTSRVKGLTIEKISK